MKPNLLLFLCLIWGLEGCYVYKPLEKSTRPLEPNLSKEENLFRQLFYLQPGEGILVTSKNGQKVPLEFQQVSPDTLFANYTYPDQKGPVKVALTDIQEARRQKLSKGLTFIGEIFGFLAVTGIELLINGEVSDEGDEN